VLEHPGLEHGDGPLRQAALRPPAARLLAAMRLPRAAQCFWIKADSKLRSMSPAVAADDSLQQVRLPFAAAMIRRRRPRYIADTARCANGARILAPPCCIKLLNLDVVL
jgi:hypothetical protein